MPLSKREREVLAAYFSGVGKAPPRVMKGTRGGKISGKRLLKHLLLPHTIITDRIRERRMREAMEELNRKYPKKPVSDVPVPSPHPPGHISEPVFEMPKYFDLDYVDEDMPQTYIEEKTSSSYIPSGRRPRSRKAY